jgi:hypothetical protein
LKPISVEMFDSGASSSNSFREMPYAHDVLKLQRDKDRPSRDYPQVPPDFGTQEELTPSSAYRTRINPSECRGTYMLTVPYCDKSPLNKIRAEIVECLAAHQLVAGNIKYHTWSFLSASPAIERSRLASVTNNIPRRGTVLSFCTPFCKS